MKQKFIDKNAIRNWTLYIVEFTDSTFYIGITSYKDVNHRLKQHGRRNGAKWARGKTIKGVIETRALGRISRLEAEAIENEMTLRLRKQYGYKRVRGGYNANVKPSIVPAYTPGSTASTLFILASLAIAVLLLVAIVLV